jgi:thiol-disulfide isomerase/thioredoxin
MIRKMSVFLCWALLVLAPSTGHAWDDLDIRAWLGDPGVKLLAVEFYATWCKPCQKAVPKWKALQKKYRAKGLRLVVVAVQSDGSCSSPDWAPDRVVCDGDGSIAERWRSQNLPQAFLWSWQGNALVANGSVEQVETAIKGYFASVPRILVAPPVDLRGDNLPKKLSRQVKQLVRSELKRASKFDLVADKHERSELRKLRKAGHAVNFDEDTQCKLGEEVSPNSQLKITVAETKRGAKLRLELFSLEKGCLTASAHAPIIDQDYEAAAVEGVAKLVRSLLGDVTAPGRATAPKDSAETYKAPDKPGFGSAPAPGGYEEFLAAAEAAKRKNKAVEVAWNVVERVVEQEGVRKEQKVAALQKFISDFPRDNPYLAEARRLRDKLTLGGAVGTTWLTLGLAGGPTIGGISLEAFRFRYRNFQWSILEYHFEAGSRFVMEGGILGLGYKWNMGDEGMHEVGFMTYPLSYGYADDSHYDGEEEYDESSAGFLNTKVYYRLALTRWHLEAGILLPLFWLGSHDDWNHEDNSYNDEPYRGVFPALWYLAGGF